MFTYDPGFTSTASCQSAITFIDGPNGVLLYRGYPVPQLAENSDYMDVSYLLLNGELPSPKQKVLATFFSFLFLSFFLSLSLPALLLSRFISFLLFHLQLRFETEVKTEMMVHEKLIQFYKGFKSDAHPMAIMVGVVGALSAFYHDT
jgi:citrate synthase